MAIGFGVLHLPSKAFWAMTPREIAAAVDGISGRHAHALPLQGHDLTALMHRYPDAQPEE